MPSRDERVETRWGLVDAGGRNGAQQGATGHGPLSRLRRPLGSRTRATRLVEGFETRQARAAARIRGRPGLICASPRAAGWPGGRVPRAVESRWTARPTRR
jgi:hypothetical protein